MVMFIVVLTLPRRDVDCCACFVGCACDPLIYGAHSAVGCWVRTDEQQGDVPPPPPTDDTMHQQGDNQIGQPAHPQR